MITVPTWFFVVLCILAGLMALSFLFVFVMFILYAIFELIDNKKTPKHFYEDPDYNPEHIPSETK